MNIEEHSSSLSRRKELKLKRILHNKQLKTIELSKRIKLIDKNGDLFTLVYDKQNQDLWTSGKMISSFYQFMKVK